jgi:hypothetical protein
MLLVRPSGVARRAGGKQRPVPPAWLVRVLGARSVLQGLVTGLAPQPSVLAAGAVVDTTHALSMVPVMIASARYRRVAALSTAVAVASAAAGAAAAGTALRTRADAGRRASR